MHSQAHTHTHTRIHSHIGTHLQFCCWSPSQQTACFTTRCYSLLCSCLKAKSLYRCSRTLIRLTMPSSYLHRCAIYDVPQGCDMVTDPEDACCRVPYCAPVTATTPGPNTINTEQPSPGTTQAPVTGPDGSTLSPPLSPTQAPTQAPGTPALVPITGVVIGVNYPTPQAPNTGTNKTVTMGQYFLLSWFCLLLCFCLYSIWVAYVSMSSAVFVWLANQSVRHTAKWLEGQSSICPFSLGKTLTLDSTHN